MKVEGRKGSTEPRIFTPPLRELTPDTSLGFEAIDFADEVLGIKLRPWQKWLLIHGLEIRPDGTYRFDRLVILVARQNGKTTLMVVLALWRMFMEGAAEIVSSAQNLGVAEASLSDGFRLAASNPDLSPFLPDKRGDPPDDDPDHGKHMSRKNGSYRMQLSSLPPSIDEGILDLSGGLPKWTVATSTRKGGRSISADLALLDEIREQYDWAAWDAITPTTVAREFGQVWAFSNAGDYRSVVLREFRDSAMRLIKAGKTDDQTLGLFEWSAPAGCSIHDADGWAAANPSMGYGPGLTEAKLAGLAGSGVNEAGFRTEYLCQWVDNLEPGKIDPKDWQFARDPESMPGSGAPIAVGVDVSSDGKVAHIAIAANRDDGMRHIEIVASRPGVDWVAEWLAERLPDNAGEGTWFNGEVAIQARGAPASALAGPLEKAGITVRKWEGPHLTIACGSFYAGLTERRTRHRGQPILDGAAGGAKDRRLNDAWLWDRHNSAPDVTPIVACTAAEWLLDQPEEEKFVSAYDDDDAELVIL